MVVGVLKKVLAFCLFIQPSIAEASSAELLYIFFTCELLHVQKVSLFFLDFMGNSLSFFIWTVVVTFIFSLRDLFFEFLRFIVFKFYLRGFLSRMILFILHFIKVIFFLMAILLMLVFFDVDFLILCLLIGLMWIIFLCCMIISRLCI